jgi:hypothetical protein
MHRRLPAATAALVTVLALVACGSGKGDKTTRATASRPAITAAPPPPAAAAKLVLTAADFPPGWQSAPHTDSPQGKAFGAQLAACVGRPNLAADTPGHVDSPDFTQPGIQQHAASSAVDFAPTAGSAREDLAAIRGPKFVPCLKEAVGKAAATLGGAVRSVDVQPVPIATFGDATLRFHMAAAVSAAGQSVTAFFDIALFLKGTAEGTATLTSVGQPVDPAVVDSVLAKLGARYQSG